jgi:hypothetical protein
MKLLNKLLIAALLTIAIACEKKINLDEQVPYIGADTAAGANIKFVNAYPSLAPTLPVAGTTVPGPRPFIYMDNQKISGEPWEYGRVFPANSAGSTNFDYTLTAPGTRTVFVMQGRVNPANNQPVFIAGDTLARQSFAFQAGKRYSVFFADTFPTPSVVVTRDEFSIPAADAYSVRFANFGSNYFGNTYILTNRRLGTVLFNNVAYKGVTPFVELKLPIRVVNNITPADTFYVIRNVSPRVAADSNLITITPIPQRVYTIYSRGRTLPSGINSPTTNNPFRASRAYGLNTYFNR